MTEPSAARRAGAAVEQAAPLGFDYPQVKPERWGLFEHAFDPILVVDLVGVIMYANAAATKHPAGYPQEQLVGRSFLELVAPSSQLAARQAWEAAAALRPDDPRVRERLGAGLEAEGE